VIYIIEINKKEKTICFSKEFMVGETPIQTKECELISVYICPKCNQILLAYFKTDEFIPVWKYDGKKDGNHYNRPSSQRDYKYRVFYAGCGLMGIELKKHNKSYGDACSFKIDQCYDLIESVNRIIKSLRKDIREIDRKRYAELDLIPENFNKNILIKNLKQIRGIKLIPDYCRNQDPLIHFDKECINHKSVNNYYYSYGKGNRKKTEIENFENMISAYTEFVSKLSVQ
jgi:hypothetical protein